MIARDAKMQLLYVLLVALCGLALGATEGAESDALIGAFGRL